MTRPPDCICDYNPDTTGGPEEDCPHHGRPYTYWVKRSDELAYRLDKVTAERDRAIGWAVALEQETSRVNTHALFAAVVRTLDDPTGHLPNCGYTNEHQFCGCAAWGGRLHAALREVLNPEADQ